MPRKWPLVARCSVKGIVAAGLFSLFAMAGGLMVGTFSSIGLAVLMTLTLLGFAIHGAWRLAEGLEAFAEPVPVEPQVDARLSGAASLTYPGLGIKVESQAGLLREPPLEVQAGGEPMEGGIDEAATLAEQALAAVGADPERIPTPGDTERSKEPGEAR